MEKDGATGLDIIYDFITKVHPYLDGIHIMAMGDIKGTNMIINFLNSFKK